MKKSKLEAAYRMNKIIELTQEKTYIASLGGFDLLKGRENALRLITMEPSSKELSYIRPSDGFSLLHFAITSHNPYLVALFIHWGLLAPKEAGVTPREAGVTPKEAGVTPRKAGVTPTKLIEKIVGIVPLMQDAFKRSEQFLQDSRVISSKQKPTLELRAGGRRSKF